MKALTPMPPVPDWLRGLQRRPVNEEERHRRAEWVRDLLVKGHDMTDIGAVLGAHPRTIAIWMRDAGYGPRALKQSTQRARDRDIAARLKEGASITNVAREFELTNTNVSAAFRRAEGIGYRQYVADNVTHTSMPRLRNRYGMKVGASSEIWEELTDEDIRALVAFMKENDITTLTRGLAAFYALNREP